MLRRGNLTRQIHIAACIWSISQSRCCYRTLDVLCSSCLSSGAGGPHSATSCQPPSPHFASPLGSVSVHLRSAATDIPRTDGRIVRHPPPPRSIPEFASSLPGSPVTSRPRLRHAPPARLPPLVPSRPPLRPDLAATIANRANSPHPPHSLPQCPPHAARSSGRRRRHQCL